MPTHDEIKAAGGNDVGDWGEKDLAGAYEPDAEFEINGNRVKLSALEGVVGSPAKPSGGRAPLRR